MIAPWAAGYIGLPWRRLGRDRTGLDCWGLARLIWAEQFGIILPAYDQPYDQRAEMAALVDAGIFAWRRVREPEPGDGVLLRIGGLPCHVGVFLGDGAMLHIAAGIDAAVERIDGPKWAPRLAGIYRHTSLV